MGNIAPPGPDMVKNKKISLDYYNFLIDLTVYLEQREPWPWPGGGTASWWRWRWRCCSWSLESGLKIFAVWWLVEDWWKQKLPVSIYMAWFYESLGFPEVETLVQIMILLLDSGKPQEKSFVLMAARRHKRILTFFFLHNILTKRSIFLGKLLKKPV